MAQALLDRSEPMEQKRVATERGIASYQIPIMTAYTHQCHCEERSDEAISAAHCIWHEIASLCSQ